MKILFVTLTDKLAEKFAALNPEINYCAIIVDQVEPAKKILSNIGLSQVPLYPMGELKKLLETLKYDYVLLVQEQAYGLEIIWRLQKYGLPTEKLISFAELLGTNNWQTERLLRYCREHSREIEIFATGTSYTQTAIDIKKFKRKAINFGTSSQDLYYSFKIAKTAILYGKNIVRYALIGLAPYCFHFDLSKTYVFKNRVLPYLVAFDDVHNFPVPFDVYKSLLREEWLNQKPSIEEVNLNGSKSQKVMDEKSIASNNGIESWLVKFYPLTRDENIKILDDYLTLCEENNIRPVMFMAPLTEKYMANFNKQLFEEFRALVAQACKKHSSTIFIDGLECKGITYADFYDHQHVNIHGAAKFSAYLNEFIEQFER